MDFSSDVKEFHRQVHVFSIIQDNGNIGEAHVGLQRSRI